jgi:hypothetical protein
MCHPGPDPASRDQSVVYDAILVETDDTEQNGRRGCSLKRRLVQVAASGFAQDVKRPGVDGGIVPGGRL